MNQSLSSNVSSFEFNHLTKIEDIRDVLIGKTHIAIMYHSHIEESNILFPSEYIDGQFYDTSFISLLEIVKDSGVYIDLLSCNLRD